MSEVVVLRHLVDKRPSSHSDVSGCLCVRGGDRKAGTKILPPGKRTAGWTLDPGKVTCPQCLEWMHA